MDNNFSAQVKEIISFSREEALRLGNDFIGTEHLLLGLIREGDNTAVRILKSFNIDLYELRKEVELAVKDKTGKNIDIAAAEHLVSLQKRFYGSRASFVVCGLQPEIKETFERAGLFEELNCTPTESEAMDIVQMEEIEREFDES